MEVVEEETLSKVFEEGEALPMALPPENPPFAVNSVTISLGQGGSHGTVVFSIISICGSPL